jgi:hypothetical protein
MTYPPFVTLSERVRRVSRCSPEGQIIAVPAAAHRSSGDPQLAPLAQNDRFLGLLSFQWYAPPGGVAVLRMTIPIFLLMTKSSTY